MLKNANEQEQCTESLANEFIDAGYLDAIDSLEGDKGYRADVAELNKLLDACLSAYRSHRRYMYLFINRAQRCFYAKGLKDGINLMRDWE